MKNTLFSIVFLAAALNSTPTLAQDGSVANEGTVVESVAKYYGCQKALSGDPRFTGLVDGWSDRVLEIDVADQLLGAERDIHYTAILTRNGDNFSESQLFTEQSDLIIGVSNSGNTQGHVYMIINGQRFDGRMYWAKSTVQAKDWKLSKGMIIRYKNLPDDVKAKFQVWLDQKKAYMRTTTCVASACKLIYNVAGFQNRPEKNFLFPARLIEHLAQTGLTTADGQKLTPEIYAINSDLISSWKNLPTLLRAPTFMLQVLFAKDTWSGSKKNAQPMTP